MAYDAPTLAELRASVLRDLRDAGQDTFATALVNSFINMGIAELNAIRPIETRIQYAGDQDWTQELPFTEVFACELAIEPEVGDTLHWDALHPADHARGYGRSGWDYFARRLMLSGQHTEGIANLVDRYGAGQVHIGLWGYADRDLLINDADVASFQTALDELIVRGYAKSEGFRALASDRALFQQWQENSNNSDVSPTQLNNMLGQAQGDFDRMRKRHHLMRRPRTG